MKKRLLSVLSFVSVCFGVSAQTNIANYTFAASTGAYAPLSSPIAIVTATAAGASTSTDDANYNLALPFDFVYSGITYSQGININVNTNGWINFGTVQGSAVYTPISTSGGSGGVISAFGLDLNAYYNFTGSPSTSNGNISYQVIGSAPNRTLVIQWENFRPYSASTTTFNGVLNFQIQLSETSNQISFVYGNMNVTGYTAGTYPQVGLRGATTTFSTDVNNLTLANTPSGTTCNWSNAVTGNSNASTMRFDAANTSIVPVNGLTYTWMPATPVAPVRTFGAVTNITASSADLTWTAPAGANRYNIAYRIPGTCSWSSFSGNPVNTNSVTLNGLTPSTIYQISVQASDGTNDAIWSHIPNSTGSGSGYTTTGTFSTTASCAVPTALNVSGITTTAATFTWTAGGTETAWDVYYGASTLSVPTATTAATATVSVASLSVTGLTAGTTYDVYVRANCGGGSLSNWTVVKNFSTPCNATNIPYTQDFETVTIPVIPQCTSVENAGTGNLWKTSSPATSGFANKALTYQFNSTNAANTWFYTQGLNLTSGISYRLTYRYGSSSGSSYPEDLKVNYGTIAAAASMTNTLTTHTNILTGGASITKTVDFTPTNTGVYYIGFNAYSGIDMAFLFVDDITVDLTPSCLAPTALNVSNITSAAATATWTAGGSETAWDVYYGPSPLTVPTASTAATATVSTNSLAITGLTAGTAYDVYVRSNCGSSNSTWTLVKSFSTPCNATNIPYTQDFETVTIPAIPLCTSVENVGTGNLWKTSSPANSGFTNKALTYQYNSTNAANTWFYTQGLNLTSGTSYRLTYRYGSSSSGSFPENLKVNYGTTAAAVSMTNTLTTHANILTGGASVTKTIDFTPTNTGVYYIGFNAFSSANQDRLFVDDINVTLTPSCLEPTSLTVSNVTAAAATATWTAGGSETAWDVYYGASPLTAPTASTAPTATVSVNSFSLTSLTSQTGYAVYVRANCGGGDLSAWTPVTTFTTTCGTYTVPTVVESFSTYLPNTCWSEADGLLNTTTTFTSTSSSWVADGFGNSGTTGAAKINIYSDHSFGILDCSDWLITPSYDLGTGTAYQLEFDLALAVFASTTTATLGTDDKFAVVISTDNGVTWSTANALQTWNSTTPISNTGDHITINLAAYSGVVKFGFYGESTVENADNDLFVDNFKITSVIPTSVSSLTNGLDVVLYPNPANTYVNINVSNDLLKDNVTVELYDAVGHLVSKTNVVDTKSNINISNLTEGIYIYKVYTSNGQAKTGKLIKQ